MYIDSFYKLPEPLRTEKIEMIEKYGSPNVFSQFQPHVTLAYDNATADNFAAVFNAMPSSPLTVLSPTLGMGRVGNWGTVLRGKDFADWPLPPAAAAGAAVSPRRVHRTRVPVRSEAVSNRPHNA